MRYGILVTHNTSTKAVRFLQALQEAAAEAGVKVFTADRYKQCDVLVLYGLGGHDRLPIAEKHLESGKPFVAIDLGYWGRENKDRVFRISFNSNHPDSVMDGEAPSGERFRSANVPTGNVYNPDGPVILVGNSSKSRVFGTDGWTAQKSDEIRAKFPDKRLIYRPKPKHPIEGRVTYDAISDGLIDDALVNASLVVCRHSNVAIDACRLGVPVVCEGGAASAIYPTLENYAQQPCEATRLEFLHRLAWWQYCAAESVQAWTFIKGKVCALT